MTTDTVGGVWTFTTELTRQLLGRGHAVHLVSFGRKPSAEQVAVQQAFQSTYPDLFTSTNSDIPLEWMQDNEQAFAQGQTLLLDTLEQHPADVILSNQFCFGRLNTSIPRVVVGHSDVLSWARACKPSALEANPWLNRYVSWVQSGLLDASAVVTPTAWMGKALGQSFFLERNYFVIPNGRSLAPDPQATEPKLQAITAGRLWDEAKGLDSLKDLTASPMPLLVAGENTFGQDARTPWPAHLTNLGPLSQPELHQRFRESAVYLCTSRYEPFGLAPLEAALCGCALVLRDLPSLREVWADNALYFTDNASLTTTLQALATRPDLLAEAQRRAGQRAAQYNAERMADSYLRLFQTVVQQPQMAGQHVA